jgi:predicted HicB family RNase H-like nuclease
MSRPDDTRPAFAVSPDSRVKLPLAFLGTMLAACAAATAAWISVRADVYTHTQQIAGLETEVRNSRELLVRIDENVKALKEVAARR